MILKPKLSNTKNDSHCLFLNENFLILSEIHFEAVGNTHHKWIETATIAARKFLIGREHLIYFYSI